MVEVVKTEEFAEFKKLIEARLDKMEESMRKSSDARVKLFAAINTRLDQIDVDCVTIHGKLDEVEAKSKSFWTRLQEAVKPVSE